MELCHSDKIVSAQERVYFINANEEKKKEVSKIHMMYLNKPIIHVIAFQKNPQTLSYFKYYQFLKEENS